MAAREQAREHFAAHAFLSDDLTADFLIQPACQPHGLIEGQRWSGGRRVCRCLHVQEILIPERPSTFRGRIASFAAAHQPLSEFPKRLAAMRDRQLSFVIDVPERRPVRRVVEDGVVAESERTLRRRCDLSFDRRLARKKGSVALAEFEFRRMRVAQTNLAVQGPGGANSA